MGSPHHTSNSAPPEFFRTAASRAVQHGTLVTVAPLAAIFASWLWGGERPGFLEGVPGWIPQVAGALACLFVVTGAFVLESRPQRARWVIVAGVGLFAAVTLPVSVLDPALTFSLLLATASTVVWVTSKPSSVPLPGTAEAAAIRRVVVARAASFGALLVWLFAVASGAATTPFEWSFVGLAVVLWASRVTPWWLATRNESRVRFHVFTGFAALVSVIALWLIPSVGAVASALALIPAAVLVAARTRRKGAAREDAWWTAIIEHPARFLVATFLATAVLGGVLLALPVCHSGAHDVDLLNAMFTAFSATCVTGLIVLDTPVDFSGAGQAVILILIQAGGLGIMTFSTATIVLLGRRMSLGHEEAVSELIGTGETGDMFVTLRRMLIVTFTTELTGALILGLLFFSLGDPVGMAAWRGLFTAISAFCNAGFALQSASLVPYQANAAVLLTVSVIIVIGGLGPIAVVAIPAFLRRNHRISLQVRMVYLVTAVLLVVPAVLFGFIEWDNTLADLDGVDGVVNAWFQSVTLRTAGFNSVDLAAVHPATLTMMLPLMFIGGSPGSTAGGIKTTTILVLVLAVVATLRGRSSVQFLRWRIPHATVYRAAAIATIGGLMFFGVLILLQLTQTIELASVTFETVSALATVGLSVGATAELDSVGKIVIIVAMFAGRVGPLTLFLLLLDTRDERSWELPEQEIAVG